MELASNVVYVVVMTQLRIRIIQYAHVVVEHILWNFVFPNLVHTNVVWFLVKIMIYVNTRHLNGYMIPNFHKDTRDFVLIAGPIEEF